MLLQEDDKACQCIHAMRLLGTPIRALVIKLRQEFPEYSKYGRDSVRNAYYEWAMRTGTPPARKPIKYKNFTNPIFFDKENKKNDPRRASLLHLLDLKRAGHSPTRTELRLAKSPDIILPDPAQNIIEPVKDDDRQTITIKFEYKQNKTPDELMSANAIGRRMTPIKTIVAMVSRETNIDVQTLLSSNRRSDIAETRYLIFWLTRKAGYTLSQIGDAIGKRDHTTVLNGLERYEEIMSRGGVRADIANRLLGLIVTNKPAPYWGA